MAKQDVTLEEFLDLAGHELRIPITVLKGQIQLLRRRWGRLEGHARDVADMDRLLFQTDRLNYMLQVMLDAFHASEGPLQVLAPDFDYDLVELVRRAVTSAAVASGDYYMRFEGPDDGEPMFGNWDLTRVETVLSVLLSNAVKYNPPCEITVRVHREERAARIEVSDTGVGIPAKDRARIFQPYTHASNVHNPGAGLGLYVAREIVRAHGGKMGLTSRKGDGSTFWFTLPLVHYPTLADQAAAASAADAEPADGALAAFQPATATHAQSPARARPVGARKQMPAEATPSRRSTRNAPARTTAQHAEGGMDHK